MMRTKTSMTKRMVDCFLVILLGHKVPRQIRTLTFESMAVGVLPDGIEFISVCNHAEKGRRWADGVEHPLKKTKKPARESKRASGCVLL
jgi:hypothetical protein